MPRLPLLLAISASAGLVACWPAPQPFSGAVQLLPLPLPLLLLLLLPPASFAFDTAQGAGLNHYFFVEAPQRSDIAYRAALRAAVEAAQGSAADMRLIRQATLDAAFLANPNRFKKKRPQLPPMPTAAWITPPPEETKPISEPVAQTLN